MKQNKKTKSIGLGSGLSGLLGTEVEKKSENFKMIPVELIKPGPWQPRKIFDKNELISLSDSIKKQGIIQPIILKTNKKIKNQYFLIAGERRWRACQLAKFHEIPAIIRDDIKEEKVAELSLVENIQRSDLNPIEEAEGYQSLINNYNYTQEDISNAVGKSRSYIANLIRLLSLSDMAKEFLSLKKLTIGQIRPLIGLKDMDAYLSIIVEKSLTSRQVEELVRKKHTNISVSGKKSIDIVQLEKELSEITGLNMNINFDKLKKAGNIKIECKNLSEFNYIIEKIKS